jgi:hypothetical protein
MLTLIIYEIHFTCMKLNRKKINDIMQQQKNCNNCEFFQAAANDDKAVSVDSMHVEFLMR